MAATARKWMRSSATVTVHETVEIDFPLKTTVGCFVVAVSLSCGRSARRAAASCCGQAANLEIAVGFHRNRSRAILRCLAVPNTVGQSGRRDGYRWRRQRDLRRPLALLNAGGLGILVGNGQLPRPARAEFFESHYSCTLSLSTHVPTGSFDRCGGRISSRGGATMEKENRRGKHNASDVVRRLRRCRTCDPSPADGRHYSNNVVVISNGDNCAPLSV
jgi:hypothetical protein